MGNKKLYFVLPTLIAFAIYFMLQITGCFPKTSANFQDNNITPNILNYSSDPLGPFDRNSLVFSDQGAWFGYGFPTEVENFGGFAGCGRG